MRLIYMAMALGLGISSGLANTSVVVKAEKHYTGLVTAIDLREHTLNAAGTLFSKHFTLGPECVYLMPDHGTGTIRNLRLGQNVTVDYREVDGVLVASRVDQNPMRFEGMVDDIDSTNHNLTVNLGELDRTFKVAHDCRIILLNHQAGAFGSLQTNNHVVVTFEAPGGNATALRIEQTSILFTGTLKAIDLSERTLKARAGFFHLKEFQVATNCAVVIHGHAAELSDLKPNDRVILSYDVINGANVVNRIVPAGEKAGMVLTDEFQIDL